MRAELDDRDETPSPQTRDMNPIYTGKDVSFIDTKQANRAAEDAVLDAEKFAVFAGLLAGAEYPQAALAKAWVQLAYGAHHDAITGSESDQVYLDLLTGWRDAWELGRAARDNSLALLSSAVDGEVVVWNTLTHNRTDIVTARLADPLGAHVRVLDHDGAELPALVEHGGRSVSWLARDVPSLGWRAYRLVAGDADSGWESLAGNEIANEHYRLAVDPARGGGVTSLVRDGQQLIADGRVGNELAVYDEYPAHPTGGEGPWHLLPKGPVVGSSETAAQVQAYRSPLGQRLVVRGRIGDLLSYTQTLTLWRGVDRVDCATTIDDFIGEDRLLRLRWPCPVPGAMPVSEVGDAVVGRGFALLHNDSGSVDTAEHPWTLDNPAYGWFGLSSAARVRVGDGGDRKRGEAGLAGRRATIKCVRCRWPRWSRRPRRRAAGWPATSWSRWCGPASRRPAAAPTGRATGSSASTPTCPTPGSRWRAQNAFTKAVLAAADPAYTHEVERQLAETGRARVWVPAAAPLAEGWIPDADLRDARALPVLVIAGRDDAHLATAIASVADDLADAEIVVEQQAPSGLQDFESRTVALFNRGVPSFAVDTDGTLHTALMRSCTGWPSGVWIDEPRRTAPDGSNFQLQHWTHVFDYALVSGDGDWRHADVPERSAEFSHPLLAVTSSGSLSGLARGRLAAAGRTGRRGAAGRAQGGRQPAGSRQRPTRRPRPRRHPAGRNPRQVRSMSPCARRWARCLICGPPTCWSGRTAATTSPACTATRSAPRWRDSTCPGCWTPKTPRWHRTPRSRSRCTRAIGCTTAGRRRWAACPPSRTCTRTNSPPRRTRRSRCA